MALPAWPANLPYEPNGELYGVDSLGQEPITTPMQAGRTRMRPQYTVRVADMRWGRFFTAAELVTWRAFAITTLGEATARFTMPIWDMATRSFLTKTVQIQGGLKGIKESPVGLDIQVVLQLRVEDL